MLELLFSVTGKYLELEMKKKVVYIEVSPTALLLLNARCFPLLLMTTLLSQQFRPLLKLVERETLVMEKYLFSPLRKPTALERAKKAEIL